MPSLFANPPPSSFGENSIAALVGYLLFVFLIIRGVRFSAAVALVVGPIATALAAAAFHGVLNRLYAHNNGDMVLSFLIGLISAVFFGGLSRKRPSTDVRNVVSRRSIYAVLIATPIVTIGYYAVWYATAELNEREFDAGGMFMKFLVIGSFAGLVLSAVLLVVRFIQQAK